MIKSLPDQISYSVSKIGLNGNDFDILAIDHHQTSQAFDAMSNQDMFESLSFYADENNIQLQEMAHGITASNEAFIIEVFENVDPRGNQEEIKGKLEKSLKKLMQENSETKTRL